MEMPWYLFVHFYFLVCLEATLGKDSFTRVTSTTGMIIFWKSHSESYLITTISKFCSTITRHIYNSMSKDTQQLKILRTWIKICADSFIKKQKSTKVPWKLSLAKNATPYFKEHCNEIADISLVIIRFFFSQTNLVFKSNLVFIEILDCFCHNLFTFLPFDILRTLKLIQCLCGFFIKSSKILMRFNVLF